MDTVFIFDVEDADAGAWTAEIAVVANKAAEAGRRLRAAGLHKKQVRNDGRPVRKVTVSEVPEVLQSPVGMARRRDNDGWTSWAPIAADTSLNWRVSGRAVVQNKGSGHR